MSQERSTMRSRVWVWWLPSLFLVCVGGCEQTEPTPSGTEATLPRDERNRIDLSSDDDAAPPELDERPADDADVAPAVSALPEAMTDDANAEAAEPVDAAAPSATPDTSEVASEPSEGHFVPEPNEPGNGGSAGESTTTSGTGGSQSSSMGGSLGSTEENEADAGTNATPLDPTPGNGQCPDERPEHGAECTMAVGTGCFYPLEKCICQVDPDGEHRWECSVTDCPLSEPEEGSDCSAVETRVCSYDRTQCFCRDGGWHCQSCFVEPPHYYDNYNHCLDEYCPELPCLYGDGWVCICSCTWECTQQ